MEKIREQLRRLEQETDDVWEEGVLKYAEDLLESYEDLAEFERHEAENHVELQAMLLNGAKGWMQYSKDGNALVREKNIGDRLKYKNGYSNWITAQAAALELAAGCLEGLMFGHDFALPIPFRETGNYDECFACPVVKKHLTPAVGIV